MTVSIILTYHRSAKIFRYIKHEIKKCHTRNTVLRYVCDMHCYMCNTANIITECNLVTNISQEGTIIQLQFMCQRNNIYPKGQWHYFIEKLCHITWKRCCRRYWCACKANCQTEGYEKNGDVIVQSSQDVATLVAQLMSATTVLHVPHADIDYKECGTMG